MFNSNPIFEFRGPWGVPVQIAGNFILLPIIILGLGGGHVDMYDVAFLLMLILSIFLHELGHAWGSLVQGLRVRRIMMHGGGGFCERGQSATRSQDELIVAMGPIVNLVIWAVASLLAPKATGDLAWGLWVLGWLNIWLALFNLIPVHPLDGGKLFHLALARLVPVRTAGLISGGVGLLAVLLWIPMMFYAYQNFGFVLFFFPSFALHWQMLRDRSY